MRLKAGFLLAAKDAIVSNARTTAYRELYLNVVNYMCLQSSALVIGSRRRYSGSSGLLRKWYQVKAIIASSVRLLCAGSSCIHDSESKS